MGHASSRAALIYQHATNDRDRAIADALDQLAKFAREQAAKADGADASGTDLAREGGSA